MRGAGARASTLRPCGGTVGRVRAARPPGGLALVELMVALAIGALVVLGALVLLLEATRGYGAQMDAADVDDGGAYALGVLGAAVRQAGYADWARAGTAAAASAAVQGADARTVARTAGLLDAGPGAPVNDSDALALHFDGAADGSVFNCAGFPVTDAARGWSIFFVARTARGEAELLCKYHGAHGWSADAIMRGVDTFQVLYGVDGEPAAGVAQRYLSASAIDALDADLPPVGTTPAEQARERARRSYWRRVVSVRVALLVHGSGRARLGAPQRWELFGADYPAGRDGGAVLEEARLPPDQQHRERHLFAATFVLRNQPW
jgi:type IV pilus assembly protein PilW